MTAATTPVTPVTLKDATTRDLLVELFARYKEGVFIGHADDKANPVHMACHFPTKMTGMHSVLTGALERVLSGIKRKYPDVPACDAVPDQDTVLAAPAVGPAAFVLPVAPLPPAAFPAATVPVVGHPYADATAARTRLRDGMGTRLGTATAVVG